MIRAHRLIFGYSFCISSKEAEQIHEIPRNNDGWLMKDGTIKNIGNRISFIFVSFCGTKDPAKVVIAHAIDDEKAKDRRLLK